MGLFSGIGGLFGSVGSAVGSSLDSLLGMKDQQNTNQLNSAEAQKNRDFQAQQASNQMAFQERMRGSQYQIAVKDLQAAGLNPMLAYSQGGAGTPSGAAGGGSQAVPMQSKVATGMSSANQAAQTVSALQSVQASQAQIEQVRAQTDKIKSETMDQTLNSAVTTAQLRKLVADRDFTYQEMLNTVAKFTGITAESDRKRLQLDADVKADTFSADSAKRRAESSLTQLEIPRSQADAKFYEGLGKVNPYLRMILETIRGGASAARIFK